MALDAVMIHMGVEVGGLSPTEIFCNAPQHWDLVYSHSKQWVLLHISDFRVRGGVTKAILPFFVFLKWLFLLL